MVHPKRFRGAPRTFNHVPDVLVLKILGRSCAAGSARACAVVVLPYVCGRSVPSSGPPAEGTGCTCCWVCGGVLVLQY